MYRSDGLLALVRRLPCQVQGCGAPAPSEPMHSNLLMHGKGKGLKADDSRVAAGCKSCHRQLDQGGLWDADERSLVWHEAYCNTMSQLIVRGWLKVDPHA